jgi:hypothetical protein
MNPAKLFNKSHIKKVKKKSYFILDIDFFFAYIGFFAAPVSRFIID